MIIGECPYDDCDHGAMRALPGPEVRLPAYARDHCKGCGRVVWVKYSRVYPIAWTESDFLAEHEIDEAMQQIREKATPMQERKVCGPLDGLKLPDLCLHWPTCRGYAKSEFVDNDGHGQETRRLLGFFCDCQPKEQAEKVTG